MARSTTSAAPLPHEIRVAIVGCGFISKQHIRSLRRLSGVRIAGVADPDAAARRRAAEHAGAGAKAYEKAGALLREVEPHVVNVLTPPRAHTEVALEALGAGCHVLLEKPMAVSVKEADEIVAAARDAGTRLCVAHNFFFMPIVAEARRLAESGALGRIVATECFWRISKRIQATPWAHELPGGVFHELAPHAMYLTRAFLGPVAVQTVRPVRAHGRLEGIQLLLESEARSGYVALDRSSSPKQHALRVYGTEMTLELELSSNTLVKLRRPRNGKLAKGAMNLDRSAQLLSRTVRATLGALRGRSLGGHDLLIEAFYRALREDGPAPVTGEDDRDVVAALDPVWRAVARESGAGSPETR